MKCEVKNHPLLLKGVKPKAKAAPKPMSKHHTHIQPAKPKAAGTIDWPSFTGNATKVGVSPSGEVTVYVDASLGSEAKANASALIGDADRIVALNNTFFGTTGGKTNVILFALGGATDGTGGADHMACDYVSGNNIEVCVAFGQDERVSALFEAELSECSMGGNLCGNSTGEALSRWCAAEVSNNALGDFASAPTWQQDGMANWVDKINPTDQDYDSIGCGMTFLSWLIKRGATLAQIAQGMVALGDSGTLAQLCAAIGFTSETDAWTTFKAAVAALPGPITSDDPFGS